MKMSSRQEYLRLYNNHSDSIISNLHRWLYGTWMHYAMRDVKDMHGTTNGKWVTVAYNGKAMNRPMWAGIVDRAKLWYFNNVANMVVNS